MPTLENYKTKVLGFYRRRRRMPSYAEIAQACGFKSRNAAVKLVDKLITLGVVAKDAAGKLIPKRLWGPVRVLGHVQAGWPSPAEEELLDTITLDEHLIRNREATYMLIARGDSMNEAGIMDGDEILVDRSIQAKSGDVVVADIDGEYTIKYFRRVGTRVLFVPANRNYKPIEPRGDQEARLVGVVVATMRKYRT